MIPKCICLGRLINYLNGHKIAPRKQEFIELRMLFQKIFHPIVNGTRLPRPMDKKLSFRKFSFNLSFRIDTIYKLSHTQRVINLANRGGQLLHFFFHFCGTRLPCITLPKVVTPNTFHSEQLPFKNLSYPKGEKIGQQRWPYLQAKECSFRFFFPLLWNRTAETHRKLPQRQHKDALHYYTQSLSNSTHTQK